MNALGLRAFAAVWKGAVAWAVVFAMTASSSALTYASTYPTEQSRRTVADSIGKDVGFAVLLGPVKAVDTVGGYTVYKCFVTLTTIGAIWALLIATRTLRGQEDAGRWQLMLATGGSSARTATAATLAGLFAATAIVIAGTIAVVLLAGRSPKLGFSSSDSVLYGLSLMIAPAFFLGVGAVMSQLARTRRLATSISMAVFGVLTVVRMIADSSPQTKWLLWATPFGWTERVAAFTDNNVAPFGPAVVTTAALIVLAIWLSGRRDAGGGLLASRDTASLRRFGLASSSGLTLRMQLPVIGGWWLGAAAAALALGTITKVVAGQVPDSLRNSLIKFGVQGTLVNQFLGVAFLFVGLIVALLPASQLGAAAEEETSGRVVHVLAGRERAAKVLLGRLSVTAGAVMVAGPLSGLFAWLGARAAGVKVSLGALVGAGLNVVPLGLLVLGLGALLLAVRPRWSAAGVYVTVVWSMVLDLMASLMSSLHWADRLSLFHYMPLAPSQPIQPVAALVMLLAAAGFCAFAVRLVEVRDLQPA